MERTLNNMTNDNAGFIQGVPVSTAPPNAGDVLQYDLADLSWEPRPVSELPSIQAVQNIGVGEGVYASTVSGTVSLKSLKGATGINLNSTSTEIILSSSASSQHIENLGTGEGIYSGSSGGTAYLKSLKAGSNVSLTSDSNEITINSVSTPSTNIYNSDGTLTGTRTITLAGNKISFGPQSPTSPAQLFIDPSFNLIGLYSYQGSVNIGDTNQATTSIQSDNIFLTSGLSTEINSMNVKFPQQSNGVLKTSGGNLIAGSNIQDLSNVQVSGPSTYQTLQYNQPLNKWINATVPGYKSVIQVSNTNITASLDTIYLSSNMNITVPFTGLSDAGRVLMIVCEQLTQTVINFPFGIYLVYNNTANTNFSINSPTGVVELICLSSNQYTFRSITGQWGDSDPLTKNYNACMSTIETLLDTDISNPQPNQILRFTGSKWINSNVSYTSNLLFSGRILQGSCLQNVYDYIIIADFTYAANASLNLLVTLSNTDFLDSSAMSWDVVGYIDKSPGTWFYVQPRVTNNWNVYTYYLFVRVSNVDTNKLEIAFQRGASTIGFSTNTGGFYFNIFNYSDRTAYTYNIYQNPTYQPASNYLSSVDQVPRQLITNFNGQNILTSNNVFNYIMNYNLRLQVWSEVDLAPGDTGTLQCLLNGNVIQTTQYHSIGNGTKSIFMTDFGDAKNWLQNLILLPTSNTLTFSKTGNGTFTFSYFKISVILSL